MKKAFVTTSIPYVNGKPHIGHALELVQSDTLVRAFGAAGYDTYFLTGTDENAQKNVESAEKAGVPTQQLVDENSKRFQDLAEPLKLSFNQFIRTTSKKHIKGAQAFWKKCEKDIYKKTYTGLYCVGCEAFYKDGEFPENVCPNHNRKLEEVSEENYFFALSRYQEEILDIVANNKIEIAPESRRNEIINFIKKGLEDFSISRPAARMKNWGIPVPGDENQRMYVWFDALTNYITALDFDTQGDLYRKFWSDNDLKIHIIGKDIIKFHAIYWVGMLMSADIPLPDKEFVHGFISVKGQKMSKTLGNVIDPFEMVKIYGTDAVRYYLLREIPSLSDGDFSEERMKQLYDSDLANELGNLLSRLTTIAAQDNLILEDTDKRIDTKLSELLINFRFHEVLEKMWEQIRAINKDINVKEPWKLVAEDRREMLRGWLNTLNDISINLAPLLPETAKKIQVATTGKIEKIQPLFPRIT
ncbi:methionine--tRNA ligase [Candidatus Woesebacteria bacterium]|nr:methionine--tRNA ligase [Candidatus Woesebacteria bacterium]